MEIDCSHLWDASTVWIKSHTHIWIGDLRKHYTSLRKAVLLKLKTYNKNKMPNTEAGKKIGSYFRCTFWITVGLTLVLLFIIIAYSYMEVMHESKKELLLKVQTIEGALYNKLNFYKTVLANVVNRVEENRLYEHRNKLFGYLEKNYKLLQGFTHIHEAMTLRWIGKPPYNFHIDQLGIKIATYFPTNLQEGRPDAKGIYSRIGYGSTNIVDDISYQACSIVRSGPGFESEAAGYICIDESIRDLLAPYKDDLLHIEFIRRKDERTFNALFNNTFSLEIEDNSRALPELFRIRGAIIQSTFIERFLQRAISRSLLVLSCMLLSSCILFFYLRKKVCAEFASTNKRFSIENNSYIALNKFRDALQARLDSKIKFTKEKLGMILNNKQMSQTIMVNTVIAGHGALNSLYDGPTTKLSIDEIKNKVSEVCSIFGRALENSCIDIECTVDMQLDEFVVDVDILTMQMIIGGLIVESLKALKIDSKIFLDINFICENNNIYAKIELRDDGLGVNLRTADKIEHSSMFPQLQKIKLITESTGGKFSCTNILYRSRKIEVKLLLSKVLSSANNVVPLFKNTSTLPTTPTDPFTHPPAA